MSRARSPSARDEETGRYLINYADPKTPPSTYTVASLADVGDKSKWTQLTDPNAWVTPRRRARRRRRDHLEVDRRHDGRRRARSSRSAIKPGKKYPLIVAIHGGPAAADMLSFNGGYGAQVYAGAGYMVLHAELPRVHATTATSSRSRRRATTSRRAIRTS